MSRNKSAIVNAAALIALLALELGPAHAQVCAKRPYPELRRACRLKADASGVQAPVAREGAWGNADCPEALWEALDAGGQTAKGKPSELWGRWSEKERAQALFDAKFHYEYFRNQFYAMERAFEAACHHPRGPETAAFVGRYCADHQPANLMTKVYPLWDAAWAFAEMSLTDIRGSHCDALAAYSPAAEERRKAVEAAAELRLGLTHVREGLGEKYKSIPE